MAGEAAMSLRSSPDCGSRSTAPGVEHAGEDRSDCALSLSRWFETAAMCGSWTWGGLWMAWLVVPPGTCCAVGDDAAGRMLSDGAARVSLESDCAAGSLLVAWSPEALGTRCA